MLCVALVSENLKHGFVALLFGEKFGGVVAIFIFVDDDVFGCRNEAVLNAAIAAQAFLIGAGVEESDVKRLVWL